MSKTLPVIGMTFSNRNDNFNECLNTKTEKVFKTCKQPLAFTIIRIVCCSERIKFLKKKNVIQLKRVCAVTVIPVLDYHYKSHPCYVKNKNIICHVNCSI